MSDNEEEQPKQNSLMKQLRIPVKKAVTRRAQNLKDMTPRSS